MQKPPEVQVQEALEASASASNLLEHPAFRQAVAACEEAYTAAWRNSGPGGQQTREDAWMMLRALDELKANLEAAAAAGKLTSFNLRRSMARGA